MHFSLYIVKSFFSITSELILQQKQHPTEAGHTTIKPIKSLGTLSVRRAPHPCSFPVSFLYSPNLLFDHYICSILQSEVRVCIRCHPDVAMSHQILERLQVHARLFHIAAIGMTTGIGHDIRYLHSINLIVISLDHMFKTVLLIHRHQRITVLIHKRNSLYSSIIFSNLGDHYSQLCPRNIQQYLSS